MMSEGLEKLIQAAREENWAIVDERIPEICNEKSVIKWAYETGIEDKNEHVRDLAASILEKADLPEERFDGMRGKLYTLMESDDNRDVRFRAACTLAAHGPGDYTREVINILQKAREDPEIAEIANGYIKRLTES